MEIQTINSENLPEYIQGLVNNNNIILLKRELGTIEKTIENARVNGYEVDFDLEYKRQLLDNIIRKLERTHKGIINHTSTEVGNNLIH